MIGHAHDQKFIYDTTRHAPWEFKKHIMAKYAEKLNDDGRRAANLELINIKEKLSSASMSLASSDDEIRSKAKACAEQCARIIKKKGNIYNGILYAESRHVKIPESLCEVGLVERLSCASWWRRALRKAHGRAVEGVALDLNIVNKHKDIYASNASLNRRRNQKSRNREILETCLAINELGDEFTLQQLSDLSVSNPKLRRMELMTRIAGFEDYAKTIGYVGEFYTFTCPSRFHSAISKTGARNKNYDGSTPRDAQAYLSKVWARIRASLQRSAIEFFGFRVCEPQQDGTPHWHLLLFVDESNRDSLRAVCRRYCLMESPNEPGAQKHRFDAKAIDWKRGTATGYIAKYIAKNIDGFGIDQDLFGNDPIKAAERVDAWASTWGIRQFQQIGGPSVTVWRELRRVRGEDIPKPIMDAHSAADTGNWRRFCEVMQQQPIALAKVTTGELGRYGELMQSQIIGVEFQNVTFPTRHHQWEIKANGSKKETQGNAEKAQNKKTMQAHVAILRRRVPVSEMQKISATIWADNSKALIKPYSSQSAHVADYYRRAENAAPWSPVNNCTQTKNREVSAWPIMKKELPT